VHACRSFYCYLVAGDNGGISPTAIIGGVFGIVVNIFLWIVMMTIVILCKKKTKEKKNT